MTNSIQDIYVVIPASGKSTRFLKQPPKLFQVFNNRPVISHTINNFEKLNNVKVIVVTMPQCNKLQAELKNIITDWKHEKVLLTGGGITRHRSIYKGLKCLKTYLELKSKFNKYSIVLIHDGARPLIPHHIIDNVALATIQYKAVGIVRPLVSTVIEVNENGFMSKSLNRQTHWASEMPQGFLLYLILKAYEQSSNQELDNGTECLKLVLDNCEVKPKLLKEDTFMFKITYESDLIMAENMLEIKNV